MPIYTFIDQNTNESFDQIMKISELDQFLIDNPTLKQKLTTPRTIDPVRLGITKPSSGFTELLNHAKSSHLHSTIKTSPH